MTLSRFSEIMAELSDKESKALCEWAGVDLSQCCNETPADALERLISI